GDVVFGAKPPSTTGAFAEYVPVRASYLLPAPQAVDVSQLAASPYAFLSAWAALVGDCGLNEDNGARHRVFIQGGGGAVGSSAVAIAKAMGAYVVTNCSEHDMPRVRGLGADVVLDYHQQAISGDAKDFDIALCTADPTMQQHMLDILRRSSGARYATLLHPTLALGDEFGAIRGLLRSKSQLRGLNRSLREDDRKVYWSLFSPDRQGLEKLSELLARDALKLRIAQHFPLERIVAAQQAMESGVSGKIVIDITAAPQQEKAKPSVVHEEDSEPVH
ncbi:MAG: zinc-binding dehydrogenase, partial [Pseudomonadota bacterium]